MLDKILGAIIALLCAMGVIAFIAKCVDQTQQNYEYVDLDNNTGRANSCSSYKHSPTCKSGDMTIQVKSYRRIKKK